MAQIVYFKDPIDETKVVELISKGTLNQALKELGIEKDPLCVTINGMTPEDVDVQIILDDTDVVEIRRLVHGGGGDSGTKQALATIVQIASLVVASFYTGGAAAAILFAGAVVSGALNKWAQDLMNAVSSSGEEEKRAAQTNNFSTKSASNKARPLMPITMSIGSHKFAPDVHADVFVDRYRSENAQTIGAPYRNSSKNFGLVASNGPMALNNSWATMPANYISAGIPQYPIKISPYGYFSTLEPLTPYENSVICDDVKNKYLAAIAGTEILRTNINAYSFLPSYIAINSICYHFDASDPYRGRFNYTWCIFRYYYTRAIYYPALTWSTLGQVFDGTLQLDVPTSTRYYGNKFLAAVDDPLTINPFSTYTLPFDTRPYTHAERCDDFRNMLLSMNGGAYTTTPKTTANTTQELIFSPTIKQTFSGIPTSTQVFNFGIGDINITDRRVGNLEVGPNDGVLDYSNVLKTGANKWKIPSFVKFDRSFDFFEDVQNFPQKELTNSGDIETIIDVSDNGKYNFVYFSGKYGMDVFSFAFKGRLYRTSPTGFIQNTTHVQVQYKLSDSNVWSNMVVLDASYEVITLENNNTQEVYLRYSLSRSDVSFNMDQYLEVRIRKVTLDSTDNITMSASDSRISSLSIVDAAFTQSPTSYGALNMADRNRPMNVEGLAIDSLISDSARTNEYTATVDSKCWVYNYSTDSWSWTYTRNPAFWFLYISRGGFLNSIADGQLTAPYSPTYGWVNYPGHPNNTDHIFGGGYKDEEIDMDKILEWGYFCQEHDLKIDMVIRDDVSVSELLEKVANVGRASVSYNIGLLSVVIEDPEQIPKTLFGMANIKAGTFSVDYTVGSPVRKVVGQFTNRETWESDTVESIVPYSDPLVVKDISIVIEGVTERDQAQREVNILAARQFYQRRSYSWETDHEGYGVERGDLVYLSHDSTQYGFSGRVMEFLVQSGVAIGFKTGSILDSVVEYVTMKEPNGNLETYRCSFDGDKVLFVDLYPIEKTSFYLNATEKNEQSDYPNSIPEDFSFIADIKETTGKLVRISERQRSDDDGFKFMAVDEDPAMWAYEFDDVIPSGSMEDSIHIASVTSAGVKDLGEGLARVFWEVDGAELVEIINQSTGLPVMANGNYSFSSGTVVLELVSGVKYDLEIRPLAFGVPYKSVNQVVSIWLK